MIHGLHCGEGPLLWNLVQSYPLGFQTPNQVCFVIHPFVATSEMQLKSKGEIGYGVHKGRSQKSG